MLLHKHRDAFKQLIEATAATIGLTPFQVEKDYYVSLLLKQLAKGGMINIVFKGGTALSKCYDVIKRFSEDIDLTVLFTDEKLNNKQRKNLKSEILNAIDNTGLLLVNADNVRSRREHNKYEVKYEKLFDTDETMIQDIIIETMVTYKPFPVTNLSVSNYITKFLENENRLDLIKQFNLVPFLMSVQTMERTFIDKIFALCDYHLHNNYTRHSRHIYDIHKMWQSGHLNKEVVKTIMDDVIKDRKRNLVINLSCISGVKPNILLHEIIATDVYKEDYDEITTAFIYEEVSYEQAILTLREIIALEIFPSVIA